MGCRSSQRGRRAAGLCARVSRRQGQQRVNPVCRSGEIQVDASRSDRPLALASVLGVNASLGQVRRTDLQEGGAFHSQRIAKATTSLPIQNRSINFAQHPKGRMWASNVSILRPRHPAMTFGCSPLCYGCRSWSLMRARCSPIQGEVLPADIVKSPQVVPARRFG